jgi:type I restriction enzyme M protein
MDQRVNLSAFLRELRERLGLSQEGLASALGLSFPTVSRWERGRARPDSAAFQILAQFVVNLGPEYEDLRGRFIADVSSGRVARRPRLEAAAQQPLLTDGNKNGVLDTKSMETLLWKAACSIRGEKDAPKFKDYILPLVFIKRLSDVFEDEIKRLAEQFGDEETARTVVEADPSLVRFYIPPEATWPVVSGRKPFEWPEERKPKTLGEQLTSTIRAITKANASLQGVIDIIDYNETRNGEREISDEALARLIETLSDPRYRLGLGDVEPDFLGRAYEYLLRKFAEGQGQSAGEFYTPKEVGWLIAYLMQPQQGEEVHDPCCGSAGLLVKCQLALKERDKTIARPLKLYGQELTGSSFAIARMNMVLHDMTGEIVRGNTMTNPKFLDDSRLKQFDIVVTNPMWNQDNFDPKSYENDPYERFESRGGYAPASSADWAWLQHVAASLNEKGRAAVVIDTGAASRGSGRESDNKEKSIRRWFVEQDLIEAVVLLPENLFYNTPAAGLIVVLNNAKRVERKHRVLMINASTHFEKGRPKNYLPEKAIEEIVRAFRSDTAVERLATSASTEEIRAKDFGLSPSEYIQGEGESESRDVGAVLQELVACESVESDLNIRLRHILAGLGLITEGTSQTGARGEIEPPDEWTLVPFEQCIRKDAVHRKGSVQRNAYREQGKYPVIDQGEGLVAGYSDDESLVQREVLPLIVFGDHTRIFKFLDMPFITGADGTQLLAPNDELVDARFLYYALRSLNIPSRGYNRHFKYLKEQSIWIPKDKGEQRKIAGVLWTIERALDAHEAKSKALHALFSASHDLLIGGKLRVSGIDLEEVTNG